MYIYRLSRLYIQYLCTLELTVLVLEEADGMSLGQRRRTPGGLNKPHMDKPRVIEPGKND